MRSIRGEALELVEGVLQALKRLVEDCGETPELIVRIRIGQPRGERLHRDLLRLFYHRSDRPKRALRHEVSAERGHHDSKGQRQQEYFYDLAQCPAHVGLVTK